MVRFFAVCFVASIMISSASAQQIVRNFNGDTVFKSMQCEIGLFAQKAKTYGLDPSIKAHIKYSTTGSYEAKASVDAGIGGWLATVVQGPKLSASYDFTQVTANTLEGKLNINQGNTATCVSKRPAIPMGITDCLTSSESALKGGFTAACKKTVTAKATFDASGKFTFWVISAGPDFSGGITVTYEINIDAPAADDKKVAQN